MVTVKSAEADVVSVSPSSERLKELWVVCGFTCTVKLRSGCHTTFFPLIVVGMTFQDIVFNVRRDVVASSV